MPQNIYDEVYPAKLNALSGPQSSSPAEMTFLRAFGCHANQLQHVSQMVMPFTDVSRLQPLERQRIQILELHS